MIVDTIDHLSHYAALNPRFELVVEFLSKNNLAELEAGIHHIDGEDVYVNVQEAPVKSRQQARFESHRRMIDIQVPVSAPEEHGWAPLADLPVGEYNADSDMTFHDPLPPATPDTVAQTYFTLCPGQFAIYFPTDGHAPAITTKALRKAIFKVKA